MLGNILREGLRSLSIAYRFCMLWLAGGIAAAHGQIAFEDATTEAGFPSTGTESWGAAWGDVDSDYFPDVFSTNHRKDFDRIYFYPSVLNFKFGL